MKWLYTPLLILAVLIVAPASAFAVGPTVLDTVPVAFTVSSSVVHTISFTYTVPAGGSNKLLVFQMGVSAGISGITGSQNGVNMDFISSPFSGNIKNMIYGYLKAPTTGTFTLTWTGDGALNLYTVTLKDAAQTSPIDTSGTNTAAPGASVTTTLATNVGNDLLMEQTCTNAAAGTFTPTSPQTTLAPSGHGDGATEIASFKAAGSSPTSETIGEGWSASNFLDQYAIAVKYQAASASFNPYRFEDY